MVKVTLNETQQRELARFLSPDGLSPTLNIGDTVTIAIKEGKLVCDGCYLDETGNWHDAALLRD